MPKPVYVKPRAQSLDGTLAVSVGGCNTGGTPGSCNTGHKAGTCTKGAAVGAPSGALCQPGAGAARGCGVGQSALGGCGAFGQRANAPSPR
jgi:hypothetical protein